MRVQPRTNDDVNEEWISDKTRYAVDGLKRQRLDMPLLRDPESGALSPVSWHEALSIAAEKISATPGSKVAALAGPLVECEALVCLKDLLNSVGSTTTTAVDVCTRPRLSVAGTRWTRCTPLSPRITP